MNGSSRDGHCSRGVLNTIAMTFTCRAPSSSVLFDGNIPTLTGLDGSMWATQLFTLQSRFAGIDVGFTRTPNFRGVRRVEVVLFNCPEWGIAVQAIRLQIGGITLSTVNPQVTSCDSLVRVCIPGINTAAIQTRLELRFVAISGNNWVHIAEVKFYGDSPTCPPDATTTTSLSTSTTRATSSSTAASPGVTTIAAGTCIF